MMCMLDYVLLAHYIMPGFLDANFLSKHVQVFSVMFALLTVKFINTREYTLCFAVFFPVRLGEIFMP